jgi:class 3 adenylate cyclase
MKAKLTGDVNCRNLRSMYHFFLNVRKWSKSQVDELFGRILPEGMTIEEALDENNWIQHKVYDDIVRRLIRENQGNRQLLFEMGSNSSKCEPLGDMIGKLRTLLFVMGMSVRAVYEKLIPSMNPAFNKTKEFLPVEVTEEGCLYSIRMFQMVDPLNDWTSDWWIRGILAEAVRSFKLPFAKVVPKVLPFDIVQLLTEEFAELHLAVEIRENELWVNGAVCGQRVYLQEQSTESGVKYLTGEWTEEPPTDGQYFEGIRITRVLPEMINQDQGWQAVREEEVYISYAEFDRYEVNPYFMVQVTWGKIPVRLRVLFFALKIFSLLGFLRKAIRGDLRSLTQDIERMSVRNADLKAQVEDRTMESRRLVKEREDALQLIRQQHLKLQEQELRIRKLFEQLHPSKRMAEIVIENGALQPQRQYASILYVDICGSTTATEKLGPEAWMAFVSQFYDIAERIIIDSGGGAYQRIGDEIVGIWIQGLTTERCINGADAALMAASSIRHALKDSFPYQVRIGISTGTIIVGSVGTEKSSIQCFGRSMNEGARFNNQAAPGQIVFGQETLDALSSDVRALFCRADTMTVRENVQLKGVSSGRTLYSL